MLYNQLWGYQCTAAWQFWLVLASVFVATQTAVLHNTDSCALRHTAVAVLAVSLAAATASAKAAAAAPKTAAAAAAAIQQQRQQQQEYQQ